MKRLFLVCVFAFVLLLPKDARAFEPKERLETLKVRMTAVLDMLAEESRTAAERLSEGLDPEAVRSVLKDFCEGLSYVEDCAFVNTDGILKYVEPATFHDVEGQSIRDQEQFRRLKEIKKPVFSRVFKSIEGFEALDYEYPVFSESGQWLGAVSALMRPVNFIRLALEPEIKDLPYEVLVLQTDGVILYGDPDEIGRNVFSDPLYKDFPSLMELCRRIVKEPSGEGTYTFTGRKSAKPVEKKAYWTTVEPGDNVWRLIMIVE